jgi:hypothetical protein
MNSHRTPGWQRAASLAAATILVLGFALPVVAYNEENVKHLRLGRLTPVSCSEPVTIVGTLTDAAGGPVVGAEVEFAYKKSLPGDAGPAPAVGVSDAAGKVETEVAFACVSGVRIIRASVAGDGAAGQIVLRCGVRDGCEQRGKDLSEAAITSLDETSTPRGGGNLGSAALAIVALVIPITLGALFLRRPQRWSGPSPRRR